MWTNADWGMYVGKGIIVGLGMDSLYHLCMQASMRAMEATFSLDLLCYMPVRGSLLWPLLEFKVQVGLIRKISDY